MLIYTRADLEMLGVVVGIVAGAAGLPVALWKVSLWLHKQRAQVVLKDQLTQIGKIPQLEVDMSAVTDACDRIEKHMNDQRLSSELQAAETRRLSIAVDRIGDGFDELNTRVGRLEGRNDERVISGPYAIQPRPKPEP